jgi:hypothetical protein
MSAEPIYTRVAHMGTDELRLHGRRVFAEILGKLSLPQLLALGISGATPSDDEADAIADVFAVMSLADPRVYPFKIARLASARGMASYGVACTLIASEGGVFGPNRLLAAARLLADLKEHSETTDSAILARIDADPSAFGVLYRAQDERFRALMDQTALRGRQDLAHVELCRRAVRLARDQRKLEPHVFLGVAAVVLDLGWQPHAVAMLGIALLAQNALANAAEGAVLRSASCQEVPYNDNVVYEGVPPRLSRRARK